SPHVGVVQRGIAVRDQIPAIVGEKVRAQGDVAEAGTGGNDLLDTPALPVVGEGELVLRAGAVGYRHLYQPVLSIPRVVPAAIAEQVAIQVVTERLGLFGDVDISGDADAAGNNNVGPDRSGRVAHRNLLPEVLLFP